jgi:hypothetical protein
MMKALTVFMMMLASCCLWAQDYPRFELSAGYSYGSVDTQGYGTQRQAQGWTGSLTTNLKRFVGAELEASGRYNSLNFDFQGNALTANNPYYTFLFGPRFAYRKGKMTPFVHTLFGVDRAPAYDNTVINAQNGTGTTPFVTGFASATGGGFDYAIGRHLLFRSQADYFFTRHASLTSPTPSNFRVLAAIVFTFGGSETLDARHRQARTPAPVMAKAPASVTSEPRKQPVTETVVASTTIPETGSSADSVIPAPTDFVAPVAQPQDRMNTVMAAAPNRPFVIPKVESAETRPAVLSPAPISTKVETAVSQPVVVSAPPATAKAETPVSRPVVVTPAPAAQTKQTIAGTNIVSSPYSVIISQPTDQQYQAASQPQESLGEVARRYRQKKQGMNTGNGI